MKKKIIQYLIIAILFFSLGMITGKHNSIKMNEIYDWNIKGNVLTLTLEDGNMYQWSK